MPEETVLAIRRASKTSNENKRSEQKLNIYHLKAVNDQAMVEGMRILSAYQAANGTKFWIITEADRSVTTVLLPDDY
jgi:hypothetical protein